MKNGKTTIPAWCIKGVAKTLFVPYVSQEAPDARRFRNDCGPACIAMWIQLLGLPCPTTDQLSAETSLVQHDDGLLTSELKTLAFNHNVHSTLSNALTLDNILAQVKLGKPPLMLINYSYIPERQNQADHSGHFVIVKGYTPNSVILNDPDFWGDQIGKGNGLTVSREDFEKAIRYSGAPYQGLILND